MSIVSIANETGLHINTVSKYFKAIREEGTRMPDDHVKQLDIIRDVVAKSQQTGMTALQYIAQTYGKNSPASDASTGNKSAAHTAAAAAAIEEQLAIVSRKLETLMTNMEVDREETNEMLATFQKRVDEAEQNSSLAISIARAALDIITRQTSTTQISKQINDRFTDIAMSIEAGFFHNRMASIDLDRKAPETFEPENSPSEESDNS